MLASCLGSVLVHFCWEIWQRVPVWKNAFAAGDWPAIEADILKLTGLLASEVMAACMGWYFDQKETWQLGRELARKQGVESQGTRDVRVTLATGRQLVVRTPYLLTQRSRRHDYRRRPGSRRSEAKGSYPVLERLGFIGRRSLLYCREVAQTAVLCPSFEVAERLLASRGVATKGNKIRTTCVDIGRHMLPQRSTLPVSEKDRQRFDGARVVIGIDGGRLRTRKQKGGRRKSTGYHGFHARWREPKMFVIYTVDAKGRSHRDQLPIHDATLGDADEVFALLEKYMDEAGIAQAKEIIFVADGAHWIWDRVDILTKNLQIDPKKITQVVDFCHACEHIFAALEAIPGLSDAKRKRLFREMRGLLAQGRLRMVMEQIRGRIPEEGSLPEAEKELQYFQRYQSRMRYHYFRRRKIPTGSGAVESAIRRVINLRLKAPGSFWREDTAEVFLYLRSQLVSGRWEQCFSNFRQATAAA
jgi:hypothetical protein